MDEYIFINVACLLQITHNKCMDSQKCIEYICRTREANIIVKKEIFNINDLCAN